MRDQLRQGQCDRSQTSSGRKWRQTGRGIKAGVDRIQYMGEYSVVFQVNRQLGVVDGGECRGC